MINDFPNKAVKITLLLHQKTRNDEVYWIKQSSNTYACELSSMTFDIKDEDDDISLYVNKHYSNTYNKINVSESILSDLWDTIMRKDYRNDINEQINNFIKDE